MENSQIYSTIGLAMRAGKVVSGEMVLNAIRNSQAKLVLIAKDASENTIKKYTDKCTYYKIPFYFLESSESLSKSIGKENRKVIAICDNGFANSINKHLKG